MLRISKLTDYGTVVLACLAASPAQRLTATEVAERTRLGLPTVSKLLKCFQGGGNEVHGQRQRTVGTSGRLAIINF